MTGHSFIRDLSYALFHRWEPERLFVILTCYFDESGTHGGSPATVMAGLMANARQWQRFDHDFQGLKSEFGFDVFHAKEARSLSGDFKGWRREKIAALLDKMRVVSSRLMEGATCTLPNEDFKTHYRNGHGPRKVRLDTEYGLCFRQVMNHFTLEAIRRLHTHKKFGQTKIHAVLESGHRHSGDVERIFAEIKRDIGSLGIDLLGNITFASKRDCNALMVSDLLASGTFYLERIRQNEAPANYVPAERECTRMTTLKFDPAGLTGLKEKLVSGVKNGGWRITSSESLSSEQEAASLR